MKAEFDEVTARSDLHSEPGNLLTRLKRLKTGSIFSGEGRRDSEACESGTFVPASTERSCAASSSVDYSEHSVFAPSA